MVQYIAILLLVLGSLSSTSALAGDPEVRLLFKDAGYSIAPLQAKPVDTNYKALVMLLPRIGPFSPNVNVHIQKYEGSLKDYSIMSKQQFKAAHFTLIKEKVMSDDVAVYEYAGFMKGDEFHWYARATKTDGKVYLVTATATETQWPQVGKKLMACVDSFQLLK